MSATTSPKAVGSPKTTKPIAESPVPDSPPARRLSLGSGNDGAGGQMFKVISGTSHWLRAVFAEETNEFAR